VHATAPISPPICPDYASAGQRDVLRYITSIPRGVSVLHIALSFGLAKISEMLLEDGEDVHAEDSNEWTPLPRATESGYDTVAVVLFNHGADNLAARIGAPLHRAERRKLFCFRRREMVRRYWASRSI